MDHGGKNLCGWELNNPDLDTFDMEIMEVFGDCGDCELLGECTTPCASMRRLVPKEGRVVELGRKMEESGRMDSYFALLNRDEVKFIHLSEPEHYWARASYISHDQVPGWALSQLAPRMKSKLAA